MKKAFFLCVLAVFGINITISAHADMHGQSICYDFDSLQEVKELLGSGRIRVNDGSKAEWVEYPRATGSGSLKIDNAHTYRGSIYFQPKNLIPPDSTEGVLTFWIYDDLNNPLRGGGKGLYLNFGAITEENGKKIRKSFSITDFIGRGYGGWTLKDFESNRQEVEMRGARHDGWTRFDIVNPKGDKAQNFIIYVDGRESIRTYRKYLSLSSFSISVGSHVLNNIQLPLYVDGIAYSSNPESYRPSVIQSVSAPESLNNGANFNVELKLASEGAKQPYGKIEVKVYNALEEEISHKVVDVEWKKQKKDKLKVEMPNLPRSGAYWLKASYSEKNMETADFELKRVKVLYLTPGFEDIKHHKLTFNDYWQFIPMYSTELPAEVPEDWSNAYPILDVWSSGFIGNSRLQDAVAGWYHRIIKVPESWQNQTVKLDIYKPCYTAYVFINKTKVGEIRYPGGYLDVTDELIPGHSAELDIFVDSTRLDAKRRLMFELLDDSVNIPTWALRSRERGLGGEVALISEPKGAHISDVAVRTFIDGGKRIWLEFECTNLTPHHKYIIKSVASAAGEIDKQMPDITFTADSPSEILRVETPWENARLWDVYKPYLYRLNAKLLDTDRDVVADVMAPVRFGFREVMTKGHYMTLNGNPLMLFNIRSLNKNAIDNFGFVKYMRNMGFNSAYRAQTFQSHMDPEFFDEAGIPRRMRAAEGRYNQIIYSQLVKYGHEDDPRFVEAWQHDAEYFIRRFRNSPSILRWECANNSETSHLEANPILQDGVFLNPPKDETDAKCTAMGERVYNYIKSLDPTRYVDSNTTQNRYDTISYHCYYGFRPIQDIIEHNEFWTQYGTKPMFYDETIAPFITDWCNSPWEGGGGHTSPRKVPQVIEWSCPVLGDDAFIRKAQENNALDAFEQTALMNLAKTDEIKDPQKKAVAKATKNIGRAFFDYKRAICAVDMTNNIMYQLWFDRTREMVYNWRADGVAGITLWLGESINEPAILQAAQQPVIGFIAGTPEKRTAKDHIFAPGEHMDRFVLIHNNSRDTVQLECEWKLVLDDKTVAGSVDKFTVSPGGQYRVPMRVRMPLDQKDMFGSISMVLTKKGKVISTDRVDIQMLAPKPLNLKKSVALVDPETDSLKEFEKLGIKFEICSFNSDFSGFDTIVFGRNAFKYETRVNPDGIDLGALTRQGKNILILEQSEDVLRNRFKFRTENLAARNVFTRINDGILFKGLPESCLKFWRGSSTLTDGKEIALNNIGVQGPGSWYEYIGNDGKPKNRFIRWGNTANIVTIAIIKPDTGNFQILADCGFNLNYAGALKLSHADGHVVFNQLDVIARTKSDPAAERYLKNLVAYTSSLMPVKWRNAAYMGDDSGKELLDFLRIDCKSIASVKEASADDVIILGNMPVEKLLELKHQMSAFVKNGGIVFSLPKTADVFESGFLPFDVDVKEKSVNCSNIGKSEDPLLQGLGNADFFWKGNVYITAVNHAEGAELLVDSGAVARIRYGKGEYVLCQIGPDIFDTDLRFWLERSKRITERTLIRLIANCNVQMSSPYLLQAPKSKYKLANIIDLSGLWKVAPGDVTDITSPALGWKDVSLPGGIKNILTEQNSKKGVVWYRKTLKLKEISDDAIVKLAIGRISGSDIAYINGKEVGKSNLDTHVNTVATINRLYTIDKNILKEGENLIEIKVQFDFNGALGMTDSDGSIDPPLAFEIYMPSDSMDVVDIKPINLEKEWQGIAIGPTKKPCPAHDDPDWHSVPVPAQFEKTNPVWDNYNGFFWYKTTFKLDEKLPPNAEPFFIAGGIDDWDVTYVNGTEIGHTSLENFFTLHSAYNTPRKYPIPLKLLKNGVNEIAVLVDDPQNDGGIWKGPVKIIFSDPIKLAEKALQKSCYLTLAANDEDPYVARHW